MAGCGGGGGEGGNDAVTATPKSTALADNAAAPSFDFANYEGMRPRLSTELVLPDPTHFADASRTYMVLA